MPHAPWREDIYNRVNYGRFEVASVTNWKNWRNGPKIQSVNDRLDNAEAVAEKPSSPLSWWNGQPQEAAYRAIHEADAQLYQLLRGPALQAHLKDLLAEASNFMDSEDERLKDVTAGHHSPLIPKKNPDPVSVAHLARAVNTESIGKYAESRGFRNRLIRLSLIGLIATALVIFVSTNEKILGVDKALWASLFGAVGALISAILPLTRAAGTWNPFSLPVYQLMVKIVLGPLFAIIGLILLQADVIPGFVPSGDELTLSQTLIWAVVFGAAQQTVTRSIDNRISGLISSIPSEDTDARAGSPLPGSPPLGRNRRP